MKKYRKKLFISLFFVITSYLLCNSRIIAEERPISFDNIYGEIAINFFKMQYKNRNINYTELKVESIKNMYNDLNEIVGEIVIINRDNNKDYVVLNNATNQIDEFTFNSNDVDIKFDKKIYYSGILNYYEKNGATYKHIETGNNISIKDYKKQSHSINNDLSNQKKKLSKKILCDGNPLPNPNKNGWNGFYSWSEVYDFNENNNYENCEWGYLWGTSFFNTFDDLTFYNQDTFNNRFNTRNSCGPTALTNMFIWFQFMEYENKDGSVNALLNDSPFDTFEEFRNLLHHNNNTGTSRTEYEHALKDYAIDQGYNYVYKDNIDKYEEFKECIDDDMPVLTSLSLEDWGGHAVLTVGYEKFDYEYEKKNSFLWWKWTTIEHKYSKYLRVVDGWDTSNSDRFIDMSGYWDTVIGRGFSIND